MDAQHVKTLIINDCSITGNGHAGVFIGSYVENVKMHDNAISGNRFADVYYK